MEIYAVRLSPGQDLQRELVKFAAEQGIESAVVLSGVGGLERGAIRYAGQDMTTMLHTRLEIVALSGTITAAGAHLHIAVSDRDGKTYGGHLQDGSIIEGGAEIVIAGAALAWVTRPRR
jgi:predicted DNA-binding protein with PD1-like motif